VRSQAEINSLLSQLMTKCNGEFVEYWGYPGQCLSLGKRWLDTLRNGYVYGPQASPASPNGTGSGYYSNVPAQVMEFFNPEPYNPGASYPAGSMFVNTASEHIGILLDNQVGSATAKVYEQNADPDHSPAHQVQRSKSRIDGILVIRVAIPTPPPAPLYSVEPITAKLVRTNKSPTYKWGMNFTFDYMKDHPVSQRPQGDIFTAVAIVHHSDGYSYYKDDLNDPDGYNILDCDDYTPPAPVYVPPAAPVTVPKVTYYDLVTTVKYYGTAKGAQNDASPISTLDAGTYVLLASDGTARKLTKKNTDKETFWINDYDNKIAATPPDPLPAPEIPTLPTDAPPTDITLPTDSHTDAQPIAPAKPQYYWIRPDKLPTRLTSTNDVPKRIYDLEGKYPPQWFPKHRTEDYSMFAVVDDKEYWLPDRTRNKGWMYGVDLDFLPEEEPIPQTALDRNANGRYDIIDIFDTGLGNFIDFSNKYLDGIKKAVTTVAPKIGPTKQRINKAVDGFSKRKP
jgi:hypothetical protein